MHRTRSHRWRRPVAAFLLAAVGTTGCMQWEPVPLAPAPFASGQYRLTLRDGSEFDLFDPRMVADSVVGTLPAARADGSWTRTVALADIGRIETPKFTVATSSHVRWETYFDGAPAPLSEIRLSLRDGSRIRLFEPEFLGDSIRGEARTTVSDGGVSGTVRVPTTVHRAEVYHVEAKRVKWGVVAAAALGSALFVAMIVACETDDRPGCGGWVGGWGRN